MNFFKKHIFPRLLVYCSPIFLLAIISFIPPGGEERDLTYFSNYEFDEDKTPIFYSPRYTISFWGLENLHPFDSKKYEKIYKILTDKQIYKPEDFIAPPRPNQEMLAVFHSKEYLDTHKSPVKLAHITEVAPTAVLPHRLTKRKVLTPMLHAAGGTILAAQAALKKGWAINLGGGFHHASKNKGHGFCAFNDLTQAIEIALKRENVNRVLYIDLDAHQGDGPSTDFKGRNDVFILDIFNDSIFPQDENAKTGIDLKVEIYPGLNGEKYLSKLRETLSKTPTDFDLILYNAGTDILSKDPLGMLDVDSNSIVKRDELIFKFAFDNKIPIAMALSGGYQKSNAKVIAESIENLKTKFLDQ